jgi:hypothetical protein
MTDLHRALQEAALLIDEHAKHPYGPPAEGEARAEAGRACVILCRGDRDKARTFWKLLVSDLGYMPSVVALALVRASNTANIVPDIPEPDLDGPR